MTPFRSRGELLLFIGVGLVILVIILAAIYLPAF
jgi:hypothetical protein